VKEVYGVATTDDGLRINLKRLFQIWDVKSCWGVYNTSLHWTRSGEKESFANISIKRFVINSDGTGEFAIAFHKNKGPLIEQSIKLVATQPRFGGKRWWFVCPRTGRKCLFLYSVGDSQGFFSRRALGLKYESQKENRWDRLLRRSGKVEERYGVPSWGDGWFPKPKGMHLRTYHNRLAELEWYQRRLDMRLFEMAARLDPALLREFGNYR
jgi:hypothetical protein